MTSEWYKKWTWEEVFIEAISYGRTRRESIGHMHMYVDEFSGDKYRLWMYVGVLAARGDIERLLDIAKRGDGLSRGRAFTVLIFLAPSNLEFRRILHGWINAEEHGDTIDVSEMLLWGQQYETAKMFATIAHNMMLSPLYAPTHINDAAQLARVAVNNKTISKELKQRLYEESVVDDVIQELADIRPETTEEPEEKRKPTTRLPIPSQKKAHTKPRKTKQPKKPKQPKKSAKLPKPPKRR